MDMTELGPMMHAWWTLWLVVVFVGIVVYAMWPGNRDKFEHARAIPFLDDSKEV